MKTTADLTEWIESQYLIGETTCGPLSVTGEKYVVLGPQHPDDGMPSIPGTKDEGARCEPATDEETAVMQLRNCFEQYREGRSGTLYWRIKPDLMWSEDEKLCIVYARMLISDKPVMRGSAS